MDIPKSDSSGNFIYVIVLAEYVYQLHGASRASSEATMKHRRTQAAEIQHRWLQDHLLEDKPKLLASCSTPPRLSEG